jgi:signal transduction histidine kinase
MRTRTPWVIVGTGLLLAFPTLWLSIRNGSLTEDGPFIPLAMVALTAWSVVGAMLASRNPRNPIGWLMIAFGQGFLLSGVSSEWALYAFETEPGALPFRTFFAWLSNWTFVLVLGPVPIMLLLYPTGSVPSPRWRPLLWALIAAPVLGAIGTILRFQPIFVTEAIRTSNPTGVRVLDPIAEAAQGIAGYTTVALLIPLCVVAVILRFRRARGEERQQIRWLAYVTAISATAFIVAVISGVGLGPQETNVLNEVSFYVLFATMALGIPIAIGVALLRHRLWDLDVVLKKTLVAAILVMLIVAVSLLAIGILSVLVVDVSDSPGLTLVVGLAIGALAWPLLRFARRAADRLVYGGRATPYEVLTEFSDRMAESYSTEDVLPRMASILAAGAGAESVTIWLLVGGELRPAAGWPERVRHDESRPTAALFDTEPGTFEVRHQGELLGAITVRMPANDPMNPSKERLIRDLASQAGLVLRNVRLIEELRESRRRIVAAVDEGRRRLERNIHDGAQQQLVALSVKIRLADSLIDRDPAKAHGLLGQLQTETTDALETLRDLARGIYPPLLQDQGLAAALEAQARRSTVPVRLSPNGIGRYPQDVEATVYFCVLEALNNVAKYSSATAVDIELRRDGGELVFAVRDDGVGFDPTAARRGTGLQGMTDRVDAIGGSLDIRSSPSSGTTVEGRVPVNGRDPSYDGLAASQADSSRSGPKTAFGM